MHEMYKLFIFVVVLSPVSVGWRWEVNNGAQLFQFTSDIDIQNTQNTQKCMKCINYLSLLWFSPQFQLGGGGESTMRHTIFPVYSWHLQSKRTQNTQKRIKRLNYLSLLRFSLLLPNCEGSHSAFIYKFKYKKFQYACRHGRATSPEHVRGGGESFKMAALLSEWCERLWNWAKTFIVDRSAVVHVRTCYSTAVRQWRYRGNQLASWIQHASLVTRPSLVIKYLLSRGRFCYHPPFDLLVKPEVLRTHLSNGMAPLVTSP